METSAIESLQRVLGQGGSRRTILGVAAAAAMTRVGFDQVAAKKKRKKRKKKNRGNGGGNNGGGNNGGGNECQFEICDGQCVDLATDPNNCGSCGNQCGAGEVCRLDFCVSAIENIDGAFGLAAIDTDSFVVTSAEDQLGVIVDGNAVRQTFNVPGLASRAAGIAFDADDGSFLVLDAAGSRVIRLNSNAAFVSEFGSIGGGSGQFENPEGIAIDAQTRQIYVLDQGNHRVQVFTDSGFNLNKRFGRFGSEDGEFDNPRGIAIDANRNVVVADTGNNRIQVLNRDGDPIRVFGTSGNGQLSAPAGVGILSNGGVVVADTGNDRIVFFDADGAFQGAIGRSGSDLGEFNAPTAVVELSDSTFVIADQGNDRVQIVNFVPRL